MVQNKSFHPKVNIVIWEQMKRNLSQKFSPLKPHGVAYSLQIL